METRYIGVKTWGLDGIYTTIQVSEGVNHGFRVVALPTE